MGLGIWLYFLASEEPSAWAIAVTLAAPLAMLPVALGSRAPWMRLAVMALCLLSLGFAAATLRARLAAEPVLAGTLDATVEGRVVEISRSNSDSRRVTLSDVVIFGLARDETPAHVRITLLGGDFARDVRIGERIAVFAQIGPPGAPVEPGGFDFRRWAWFEGLGGVGFARGPAMSAPPAEVEGPLNRLADAVGRLRGDLSRGIQRAIPGENGAFASAILTGARDGVTRDALTALRDSNLAHLLAISGLHMGLLSALVFGVVRLGLSLIPAIALRYETKKLAAGAALLAGLGYLVLSGASVATQRAFVMAAAALIAVMLDRAPISLRALAAAALAILAFRPESLLNVGFQMSFAATTALIAVYEAARERRWLQPAPGGRRAGAAARYAIALALTSLIAGMATAPYAALSFNRLAAYGLIANLAAVPVMAFWVMPAGLLAATLAPLGLEDPALWVMGRGIGVILGVARFVADLPGAVRPVAAAHDAVLPLLTLGGLWLCIWRTWIRALGLAPLIGAFWIWAAVDTRPELLIAQDGRAIGLMGPQGRAVDRARGAGYDISTWLARDGDLADQEEAAQRPGLTRTERGAEGVLPNGWRVTLMRGRIDVSKLIDACAPEVIVIAPRSVEPIDAPCALFDRPRLTRSGAVAIRPAGAGISVDEALDDAAGRAWGAPPRRRARP